jgi:hypothetical protein
MKNKLILFEFITENIQRFGKNGFIEPPSACRRRRNFLGNGCCFIIQQQSQTELDVEE